MNKLWFTNKKKYKNYSENLSEINHKLINKKNTKLTKLAMFSWIPYTSIHSPNIFINVKNHPTFPSSFFDARSLSLIHRGWTTSGGVSNLLQLQNLSLVPLVWRNFRWTNEVTLFQPLVRSLVKIYRITVLISGRRNPKSWPSITTRSDDIHSISYLITLNISLLCLNPHYNLCIYILTI